MAAAIALNATTVEQQALELGLKMSDAIAADKVANPTADLKSLAVSKTINLNTNRATFTITIPLVPTNSADGGLELDAEEVLA